MTQPLTEFGKLILLSIACGAISLTISKAKIFAFVRNWIKSKSEWAGNGISCPYCTSHWVAAVLTLLYFPRPVTSGVVVFDFFIAMMTMVALASITARVVYSAYAAMSD